MDREQAKRIMEECLEDARDMGYRSSGATGRALVAIEVFRVRVGVYD